MRKRLKEQAQVSEHIRWCFGWSAAGRHTNDLPEHYLYQLRKTGCANISCSRPFGVLCAVLSQAEINSSVELQILKMLSGSAASRDTEDVPSQMKAWAATDYALDQIPSGLQDLLVRFQWVWMYQRLWFVLLNLSLLSPLRTFISV